MAMMRKLLTGGEVKTGT